MSLSIPSTLKESSIDSNLLTQYYLCHVILQCPDSASKKDLIAYLQRIALYCHQLNITSKVKADVQSVGGELIVSGVGVSTDRNFFLPSMLVANSRLHLLNLSWELT